MKNFTKSTQKVSDLLADDWFRVAGQLYRVKEVMSNGLGEMVIHFYPAVSDTEEPINVLIVANDTVFVVHTQHRTPYARYRNRAYGGRYARRQANTYS